MSNEKTIKHKLAGLAWRLLEIKKQVAELEKAKKNYRDQVIAALDALAEDTVLWEQDQLLEIPEGKVLKLQRERRNEVVWNIPKIVALVTSRNLADRILKVEVDEKALEEALKEELVSVEQVKECVADIKYGSAIRVDLVKAKPEGGA